MKNFLPFVCFGILVSASIAQADTMTIQKSSEGQVSAQLEKIKMMNGVGPTSEIIEIASKCGLPASRGAYGVSYFGKRIQASKGSQSLSDLYQNGHVTFSLNSIHEAALSENGNQLILIGDPATELMRCMQTAGFVDKLAGASEDHKSKHVECKKLDTMGFATCTITQ